MGKRMSKLYLLIAGDHYYPNSGTGDWHKCFSTEEEAQAVVTIEKYRTYGKKCEEYHIDGEAYAWYEIVNLQDWINNE